VSGVLDGQVAVVTGSGSGIGRAIARELGARGAHVVATDLDEATARETASSIASAEALRLDVTDAASSTAVADDVASRHGRLDIWASNAGISKMQLFVDISEADYDRTLDVNLKGIFLCGQAAARAMIRLGAGGAIVNTASMAGKQGRVPFLAEYVASKFGVVGLTQAMAFELAPHRIRVNCVCPGYVETSMMVREQQWEADLRGTTVEAVREAWVADTPLRRLEQPEDVARGVAFLAGPDASFITGEALAVNGGAFMD
jgi:meso-butanediol dehydrogenase / (S,S)-butanediol dehydrogenase / diacetyl reductase